MSRIAEKLKSVLGFGGASSNTTTMKPSVVVAIGHQIIKNTKPRVPLIKFRKSNQSSFPATVSGGGPSQATGSSVGGSGVIQDYELPLRFRRRPLAEDEIAYINLGGPPDVVQTPAKAKSK